jgi:hypothetical protein
MWQRYPGAQNVLYKSSPRGGFDLYDELSGEQAWAPDAGGIRDFALDHPAYYGGGDLVAKVAKPVARMLGMPENCSPCQQRQALLNQLFPNLVRR